MTSIAMCLLGRLSPKTAAALRSSRARIHSHQLVKRWGLSEINQTLIASVGMAVGAGPFQGLRLPEVANRTHIGPFLLGTYEMELHSWWNDLLRRQFDVIVDIGAYFGYYAVGLARRYPSVPVVAFDTDRWARRAIARTAEENGVTNVIVRDYCTPTWLAGQVLTRSLIVCDCEGFELELFGRASIGALDAATMIIELHEGLAPGVTAAILARFRDTHTVDLVSSRIETPISMRVDGLTPDQVVRAAAEVRSPLQWVRLEPKAS